MVVEISPRMLDEHPDWPDLATTAWKKGFRTDGTRGIKSTRSNTVTARTRTAGDARDPQNVMGDSSDPPHRGRDGGRRFRRHRGCGSRRGVTTRRGKAAVPPRRGSILAMRV